jgi:two-component system, cell cycle response regulator DivK
MTSHKAKATKKATRPTASGSAKASKTKAKAKGKPKRKETGAARPVAVRAGEKAPAVGSLVLVVDDFHDNREMYMQYLSFAGYRVAEAVDGEDALAKARSLLPDVIVMDLSLPRLDGWEATRRLKKDPLTQGIPVIALTGHALAGHAEGALGAGCDAFVTKPCVPSELEGRVREMLNRAGTAVGAAKPRR